MSKLKELKDDPKYIINFVEILSTFDPSKTGKYVPYMLKLIEAYIADVKQDYLTTTFNDVKELIQDFHDLAERNQIENKDIYSYESFEQLETIVKEGKSKITESQIKERETKILHEDDNYIVIRPLSIRSSRLYGSTTKWCTASDRDDYAQHFRNYAGNGILVYFINKKENPKENLHAKLAFHNETNFKDSHNISIWDVEDKKLDSGAVFGLAGKIIPMNIYEIILKELNEGKKVNVEK